MNDKPPRLPSSLYLKSLIVRTFLAGLFQKLRWLSASRQRYRHPELWELYLEEQRMPLVLRKALKNDSCGIDVGGHIGSFLVLLKAVAPQGHHSAFEASPRKYGWLKKRFPEVAVFPYAVADKAGRGVFQEDCVRPGYSALQRGTEIQAMNSIRYDVETCCLDDVLIAAERIDLIKLDIEGGELAALRGATKIINKWKPVIIFECGSSYSMPDSVRLDLYQFITKDLDYRILSFVDFLFDKGEMAYDEFRKFGLYPFRGFNFVALPQSAQPNR